MIRKATVLLLLTGVFATAQEEQGGPSQSFQDRMRDLHQRVERRQSENSRLGTILGKLEPLMKEGKFKEAEAVLDEAHKLFDELEKGGKPPAPSTPAEDSPRVAAFERIATGYKLAEGPVWHAGKLYWSDIFGSTGYAIGADGQVVVFRSNTRGGNGMAFDSKGRLVVCEAWGRRITRVEKDGSEKTLVDSYQGKKLNMPNDLAIDAKDGIYFTDPCYRNRADLEQDKEAVYYVNPEGKIFRVAEDLQRPNGVTLSKDGKTLLVADDARRAIRAYPVKDDGTLGEGREFAFLDGGRDGLGGVRFDSEGNLYAAAKDGLWVWDAAGKSLGKVKVPEDRPMKVAVGDPDGKTLYFTTPKSVYKIRVERLMEALKTAPAPRGDSGKDQNALQEKMQKLQAGIQRWVEEGKDPSSIGQMMQEEFGPLLQQGRIKEAEAVLDRALKVLEGEK